MPSSAGSAPAIGRPKRSATSGCKALGAAEDVEAEDLAWMAVETDVALRQAGLAFLKRSALRRGRDGALPAPRLPRPKAVRRQTMQALETLAGGNFLEKVQGFLGNPDPVVVHAALDYLKKSPSERALPWMARVLSPSNAPALRKKAFAHRRGDRLAAVGQPRAPRPRRRRRGDPLPRDRGPREVPRRDADRPAAEALPQRLAPRAGRRHRRPRAAAGEIPDLERRGPAATLGREPEGAPARLAASSRPRTPGRIADAFLRTFRTTYGPAKDRAVEALRELGPEFIRAFLDRGAVRRPASRSALAVSIAVTIRAPEAVPHCIRFLSGEDWWLRDRAAARAGRDPRRDRAAAPPEDAPEPRVEPLGRRRRSASGGRPRRCPDCSRPTSRPIAQGPAPRDPRRLRANRGPARSPRCSRRSRRSTRIRS